MIDPLATLPGYLLRRASNAMMAMLARELEVTCLTTVEASILTIIQFNDGIRQVELCQILDIKKANMTPRIASLEKRRLVGRKPIDGRSSGLFLTSLGQACQAQAWQIMQAHERAMLAQLGASESVGFAPALVRLWQMGNPKT